MNTLRIAAASVAVILLIPTTTYSRPRPEPTQIPSCSFNNNGRTICSGPSLQAAPTKVKIARSHARRHRTVNKEPLDASGNVVSHKTGAVARVAASVAAKFQGYIDDLEAAGAKIIFMGGIRRGRCSSGHMHPCGKAIDTCQLSRGRVDSRCHLPDRQTIAAIAARHGLFEGGQWCNSDYGHAQAGVSAPACGTTMMASRHHKRHSHHRYASR